jgi:hypothetical protein
MMSNVHIRIHDDTSAVHTPMSINVRDEFHIPIIAAIPPIPDTEAKRRIKTKSLKATFGIAS